MNKSLFLLILTITTPATVWFLGAFNYYSDYVASIFTPNSNDVFDFIIVGSGSAGAVVALRLSKHYKVLLLEAGGKPNYFNSIPGFAMDLLGYWEDWNYKSVPQKHAGFSLNNNQVPANRGKVLGGTSVLNYLLYLRGSPFDYDNWANLTSDPSWSYKEILKYFKKSIKEYRGDFKENTEHYGDSPYGFLTIESMNWAPSLDKFLKAGVELGYKEIDANGPQSPGVGKIEVTHNFGTRMSLYHAILKDLYYNKNIQISTYSQATKIKFNKNNRAVGVWYYHHGVKKYAKASKEIILSAGSYDSPKLLMLSGVGVKSELESIGIKHKIELPVGKNLQDHFGGFLYPFTVEKPGETFILERDLGLEAFMKYYSKGKGPLTGPSALCGQLFFPTSQANSKEWSNVQLFFLPIAPSILLAETLANGVNLQSDVVKGVMEPNHGKDGLTLVPILVRPKSVGEIKLKDKNPFSDPLIDPKYLEHPDDIKALVEAFKVGMNLAENTKTFKDLGTKFTETPFSKCKDKVFRSDSYWECHIRHNFLSIWHPVGTCKMGKPTDPTSVVDSNLKVIGTQSLRVIDASIMPFIVNANTNAPSIMIGEKGADMILEYWSLQHLVCDSYHYYLLYENSFAKCFYLNYKAT